VFRFGLCAPLAPLHSANSLRADQVRPCTRHRGRFLVPVKIDQHFALRGFEADPAIEVHHHLVAALHEVDFNPLDAPLRILIESGNQLIVEIVT